MDAKGRAAKSPGFSSVITATSVVALLVAGRGQAKAAAGYPTLGLEIRNGDALAFEAGAIVVFDTPANPPRPFIASLRGELAVGGAGAGIGLVIAGTDKRHPDLRDLFYSGLVLAEMRVERMYGSTTWNHTTYAGPHVTLSSASTPKLSLGWMADIHNAADNHVQVGIGVGF